MGKISTYTEQTALPADTDMFVGVFGGTTKKFSFASLRDDIRGNGTDLSINGSNFLSIYVELKNNSGTIQHRIVNQPGKASPYYGNAINGATSTWTNTPTGTDSSTAMAAGAKISTTTLNLLYLDTADLDISTNKPTYLAAMSYNSTDVSITQVNFGTGNIDINGSTRNRIAITYNDSTGAGVTLNTTNIPSGRFVYVFLMGFAPDYA